MKKIIPILLASAFLFSCQNASEKIGESEGLTKQKQQRAFNKKFAAYADSVYAKYGGKLLSYPDSDVDSIFTDKISSIEDLEVVTTLFSYLPSNEYDTMSIYKNYKDAIDMWNDMQKNKPAEQGNYNDIVNNSLEKTIKKKIDNYEMRKEVEMLRDEIAKKHLDMLYQLSKADTPYLYYGSTETLILDERFAPLDTILISYLINSKDL